MTLGVFGYTLFRDLKQPMSLRIFVDIDYIAYTNCNTDALLHKRQKQQNFKIIHFTLSSPLKFKS